MKFQGTIARGAFQGPGLVRVHQGLLQLFQQARRPGILAGGTRFGDCRGGGQQILLLGFPELGLAAAFEQLLEFGAKPAKPGLQARHAQAPRVTKGIQSRGPVLRSPERGWIPVDGAETISQSAGVYSARIQAARIGIGLLLLAPGPSYQAPGAPALPQVPAGGEQVDLHRQLAGEGLEQVHLDRRHAAQTEQAQGRGQGASGRQGGGIAPFEGCDRLQHPQAEGPHPQAVGQLAHEQGLPELVLGQGLAQAVQVLALAPGRHHGGPVQGVVVKGIGDGPAQLPEGPVHHHRTWTRLQVGGATAPAAQPLAQLAGFRPFHQLGQQLQ